MGSGVQMGLALINIRIVGNTDILVSPDGFASILC
eukprot:SAG31_NODE_350_length_17241_cov_156.139715_9_plen_35_part_00